MPDRDVKTIRDLIFYQYAKIIAKRAFTEGSGERAKREHYGFIKTCDKIQGIHNQVWACSSCNSAKGTKGPYEFYRLRLGGAKFYDGLPVLLEKKYLKTIYCCHECAGTPDKGDFDGEEVLSVIDIDAIIRLGRVTD